MNKVELDGILMSKEFFSYGEDKTGINIELSTEEIWKNEKVEKILKIPFFNKSIQEKIESLDIGTHIKLLGKVQMVPGKYERIAPSFYKLDVY